MQAMPNKQVVLFNGPPGSGKDLSTIIADNFLTKKYGEGQHHPFIVKKMKFAETLKAASHALLGIPYSTEHYERIHGNGWKDEAQVEFFGKTPRSEYIALSEEFAKLRHGNSVFGRVAARTVTFDKSHNTFVFSDSGFADEVVPLVSAVGVNKIFVIELERPGCTFDGDSRGYIGAELSERFAGKIQYRRIRNDDDKQHLTLLIKGILTKYLKVQDAFD